MRAALVYGPCDPQVDTSTIAPQEISQQPAPTEQPLRPLRKQRFGDIDVVLVGKHEPGPLVVLLHGYGAPATDLTGLAERLVVPEGVTLAFPGAPLSVPELGPDARAWWPIDLARLQADYLTGRGAELWRREPAGLDVARGKILHMLAALLQETRSPPHQLLLGGFSQGAILACDVAFRSPHPLGGLIVLSGAPVAEDAWKQGLSLRCGLPVFQSHGTLDPILPLEAGSHLRTLMDDGGLSVHFERFAGGHGIAPGVVDQLGAFATRILSQAS